MPSRNPKQIQGQRAAEEDARRRLGAATSELRAGREEPSAHRATTDDAKTPSPNPDLAGAAQSEMPRIVKTPEQAERAKQHAEVIERLDAINASQQRTEALLQQIVSLLSQGKA